MNVVKDLQSLIQLMHSRDEVIIFPIGGEGQQLLDLLRYGNLLHRVCCIAAQEVDGGVAQRFNHEVPIIPFENLVHFRESALLIVATSDKPQNANIDAELARFGFKFVVFVSNEAHAQIRNELQKLYATGQVMMWYMRHFDKKITDLEYRIAEQNEVSAVNTKAFAEYRNAFRGKEVVIVGCGPTLKYYTPIKDAIHVGLNRAWKRDDIKLDYLFVVDGIGERNKDALFSEGFGKILGTVFVAKYLNHWNTYPEDAYYMDEKIKRFCINTTVIGQTVYADICYHALADFNSVAFSAFRFALFTSPKRIYFVGCDSSPTGHFFKESQNNVDRVNKDMKNNLPVLKLGYARMKMFAKQYYPDTEIISINPVGLRGLFKDVYTEEYKAALNEKNKIL